MSSPNSPIENGDVNEHSSTDEEQEPISYNNPLSALTSFTPLDLNEDTDEMSNDDEEQEETSKPPPLTSEQAKQHKLAWDAYTSRSRKLTAEELHLVAVYGPPEDEEDEAQEEEDIDGMVILSSSNRTEQPSQTTMEDVDDTTIEIPEPIQDDYNEYEQIFFDDSSDGESIKKKKRRKKKQIEEESDGEFHPPKTSKPKKSKKNLRHRRTSSEPPPPPPAIVEIVPQPFLDIICVHCKKGDKEDELLLCDKCDIGSWHMSCLNPPLTQLPSENEQWFCPSCSEESTKLKMLELSDIIREKDRVVAQIRANLMKRKSIENEKIEIEKPPEPKKTYEKKIVISTPIPSESLSNTTSSNSSNLLLLNKSFSINSQNVTKKPSSNPTNSPFWIGPLYWDDKCICKVAVYFPSVPTPISQDLKHNFPENLKISSSKDFPANSLKNSNVEIVPETDHATFLYFMHSMERSKNVGTMWLGAIGPNIYFVPNKSKKTISIYVPVKPSNNPTVTNNVVSNNNVQYLVQIAPGQFVSVTSDMMVPVQYYPVPQSTAFVTLPPPPQPMVPQQQRSSPKKIASPVNKS